MPHAQRAHRDRWHLGNPLPLGTGVAAVLVAVLAILILLILFVTDAKGNFVYWSNQSPGTTLGRAKINGAGLNDNFITGLNNPQGVATDSKFIYWADTNADRIGRANLDGSGVNHSFITLPINTIPTGIAVTSSGIYWGSNGPGGVARIGRANIDGSGLDNSFVTLPGVTSTCGIAADQSFVYWLDLVGNRIGRAPLGGGSSTPGFISVPSEGCGLAVDASFLYWATGDKAVGRVPVGGGTLDPDFTPSPGPGFSTTGVAVQPQYVFWINQGGAPASNFIARANLNGSGANQTLIAGLTQPSLMSTAPSNKVTVNSIKKKKRKGTAVVNAKVPGPGQVTLSQTAGAQDPNAIAATVKPVGLTITGASSFKLPIKPLGKTRKKLSKQVKRSGKGKVKVKAFITFVPAGVAGVPNTDPVKTKLIKQRKRKKK